MPWVDEQERLTLEARLQAASSEEVYRELKEIGQKPRLELFGRGDDIEVERDHVWWIKSDARYPAHRSFKDLR